MDDVNLFLFFFNSQYLLYHGNNPFAEEGQHILFFCAIWATYFTSHFYKLKGHAY